MFRTAFFLAAVLFTSAVRAEPADGRVELSLTEWRQTLEKLRLAESQPAKNPAKPAPPLSAIVYSAVCEVAPAADGGKITIEFDVETLADGWSVQPLLDDSLPLESLETNAGRIIHREGRYALLTDGPTRAKVRLVLLLPKSNTATSDLWLAEAISARVRLVSAEPKVRLQANSVIVAGNQSSALALPSGTEKNLSLRLITEAEQAVPDVPGQWQSRAETLIKYEDGRLNFLSRVVLWSLDGNDRMAVLTLPAGAIVLGLQGEDAPEGKARMEKSRTNLPITWKTAGQRQRVVEIRYALEHRDLLKPWPLVQPGIEGMDASAGTWLAAELPGIRFLPPLERPNEAALSGWMREQLGKTGLAAFSAPTGSLLPVETVRTIALAGAGISRAEYQTRLARGGGVLTEALLTIKHTLPVGAEFQLRQDARLIACQVNALTQAPVDLGEGRFRVSLPAGSGESRLQFTFAEQGPPLQPASGQIRLELPASPLLADVVEWNVLLPADLELNTFEGSVTAVGGGNGLRFRQELCQQTAPQVVLFYQKKIK